MIITKMGFHEELKAKSLLEIPTYVSAFIASI